VLLCAVLLVAGLVAGWRGLLVLHGEIGSIHIWRLLGGLGLTVVAFALLSLGFRLVLARVQDAWFWIVVAILVAVIAGLSVLACAWMAHDQLLAGWLAGGVAVAVSAVVLVAVVREYFDLSSAEDLVGALVGLALFEGAAISIAVVSGLHSHSVAAWVFGLVAALPALAGLGYLAVMTAGGVRETSASFLAQLAGLLVPVGSIVAAATWQRGSSVDGQSPALFGALGTIALLAAVAFGLQRVFLGWLSTGAAGRLDAFNAADHDEDFRSSRSAYDRERRYLEADRDADLRHLDGLARRRAEEEWSRRLESMQERWQAHRQQREQEEYERWASPRVHPGWSFPAVTDGMLRAEAQTYRRTGLALATVWPRIELVLPAQVRRPFRRAERSIGALRVAVASAVNTAIS